MFLLFSIAMWFDTCLQVCNSLCDAEEDDDDGDDYRNSDRDRRSWFLSIEMCFLALPTLQFCLKIFLTLQIIFLTLYFTSCEF